MYSIGGVDVVEHICGDETKIRFVAPPPPPLLLLLPPLLSFAELFAVAAPAMTPIIAPLDDVVVTAAPAVDVDDELTMRMFVDEFDELRPAPFVTVS